MSDVILAVIGNPEVADRILSAAVRLARLTGATFVNVLVVRTPPLATILPTEEMLTETDENRIRATEKTRAAALKAAFEAWLPQMSEAGLTAKWNDVEGRTEEVVAEWGRRADFIVLKRPWYGHIGPGRHAIHAALFDSGRPVLVVPPEKPPTAFGRRVAVAWRNDPRTMQAVLSAFHCLKEAEHVFVLAGYRAETPLPSIPDVLAEHAVKAELHVLPIGGEGVFGEALLTKAHELGADMLVLGAYVHTQFRSLILGGVTRHILAHADLPVLMRH